MAMSEFGEIGTAGLKRQGGLIYEEFLRELQGQRGVAVFKEMAANDAIIGSMLYAVKQSLRNIEWNFEGPNEELNKFAGECMDDMSIPWQDVISEILSMCEFGWSYHEVVYKRREGLNGKEPSSYEDGKIGWRKMPIRAQETLFGWKFNSNGRVQAMQQRDPRTDKIITIPMSRSLLFRTQVEKDNPEGRSLLRNAYVAWYRKKHIELIEAIGIERDLTGLPVAWVPPEILDTSSSSDFTAVRNAIKTTMANIRRDDQEYLIWPLDYDDEGMKRWDFTLATSGGNRAFDTSKIISRYNQAIAMSVLADVILLGHENVGSFALSQTKGHYFVIGLKALANQIENVFNKVAIPRLMQINGYTDPTQYPKLKASSFEHIPLEQVSNFLSKATAAGMPLFPDEALEEHLRREARFPARPSDWDEYGPEVDSDMIQDPDELEESPLTTGGQRDDSEELNNGQPRRS